MSEKKQPMWSEATPSERHTFIEGDTDAATLSPERRQEMLEELVARCLCEWAGHNPDHSLGGDGVNFRWIEELSPAREVIEIVRKYDVR